MPQRSEKWLREQLTATSSNIELDGDVILESPLVLWGEARQVELHSVTGATIRGMVEVRDGASVSLVGVCIEYGGICVEGSGSQISLRNVNIKNCPGCGICVRVGARGTVQGGIVTRCGKASRSIDCNRTGGAVVEGEGSRLELRGVAFDENLTNGVAVFDGGVAALDDKCAVRNSGQSALDLRAERGGVAQQSESTVSHASAEAGRSRFVHNRSDGSYIAGGANFYLGGDECTGSDDDEGRGQFEGAIDMGQVYKGHFQDDFFIN